MRTAKNIETLLSRLHFKAGADLHERAIADALEAQAKTRMAQSPGYRSGIWRLIMKNNLTRLSAAVVVLAVLVGAYQLGGGRVFAQTTRAVKTGLAGLRDFISDIRTGRPEQPATAPSVEPSEPRPAAQGNRIYASVQVFSVPSRQQDLREFFEAEGIELAPAADGANTSYAKLGPQKTERLLTFTADSEGIKRLSSPSLTVLEGQEGMIGIVGDGKPDALALAFVATVVDDSNTIELTLSFLHGEAGFEVPRLRVGADEAVLFSLLTTMPSEEQQNDQAGVEGPRMILVLLRTKVFPQP